MIRIRCCILILILAACSTNTVSSAAEQDDIFAAAKLLSRGVNLGNALEAPAEGEWGMTLKTEYFDAIARTGFDSVRIPIRWSAHADREPPYAIDEKFFTRIDWA